MRTDLLLNVESFSPTSHTQCVCLVMTFSKAGRPFSLKKINFQLHIQGNILLGGKHSFAIVLKILMTTKAAILIEM